MSTCVRLANDELSYLKGLRILVNVCGSELRRLFKEVWDKSKDYAQQPWQDDPVYGNLLFDNHKPKKLKWCDDKVKTGQRDDWDMTVLCRVYIWYTFMKGVDEKYSDNADTLRKLRNIYAHPKLVSRNPDDFKTDVQKIEQVFRNLNLNQGLLQQALDTDDDQDHAVLKEELNTLKNTLLIEVRRIDDRLDGGDDRMDDIDDRMDGLEARFDSDGRPEEGNGTPQRQVVPDWFSCLPEAFRHKRVTEQDLVKIVSHIGDNWEMVAVELGIKKPDREKTIATHRSVDLQMMEVFMKWVQRESRRATREAFVIALFACNDMCTIDWDGIEEAAKHLK